MADSFGDLSPSEGTLVPMDASWFPARRTLSFALVVTSLVLIWGTALGGRSFGPVRAVLVALPYGDKVGHFVLYGLITLAAALLARNRSTAYRAALVVIGLGVVDEFRQLIEGDRNFSIGDVLANAAGVVFGLLVALAIAQVLTQRSLEDDACQPSHKLRRSPEAGD